MRTIKLRTKRTQQGNAIVLTMVYVGLSLLLLATIIGRSSSNAVVTQRNNAYNQAVTAAEAATETVLAKMFNDFVNQSIDYSNLVPYRAITPSTFLPAGWPAEYEFSDRGGNINQTDVTSTGPSIATTLDGQFAGLYGIVFPFRVISNAKHLATPFPAGTGHPVEAAVQQDFQLACIPVFQFMCFYTMNLEINPSPQMILTGKVHGNANIYAAPVTGLEFKGDVGAVGHIYNDREKNDPQYGSTKVAPVYDAAKMESPNVSSLTLPVGTNSGPTQVRQILDPPPLGEDPQSPMGQQRYYNKADLIMVTSASGVVSVESGAWNNFTPLVPDLGTNGFSFVSSTNSFDELREGKPTVTTEIDVAALNKWMTNSGAKSGATLNSTAQFQLGHQLNSVYVNDNRVKAGKLTVVRVSNGAYLPPDGLTVATDRPLYVKGNYNAPDLTVGSTDTSKTKPASLIGDAITVLSTNWNDAKSFLGVARTATNTTVNAAFLAGIVETTNSSGTLYYSGGLENFPRFLEDWGNGKTLTYNGSMVVLFPSRYATGFWGSGVYTPPVRKWAFDMNFLNQKKLPPCTPEVRKLLRGQWAVIAANSP
jgi:hypothetical protein